LPDSLSVPRPARWASRGRCRTGQAYARSHSRLRLRDVRRSGLGQEGRPRRALEAEVSPHRGNRLRAGLPHGRRGVAAQDRLVQELRERVHEIPFRPYTPWQLLAGVAALIVILGGVIWGIGRLGKDVTGLTQLAEKEAAQRETAKELQQRFAERFLENLIRDK